MSARRTEFSPRPSTESPLLEETRSSARDGDSEDDEVEENSCGRLSALCRCFGLCWVAEQEKHDAGEANRMIGRLGVWLAANSFLFLCMRVAVACGLPYDAKKGWKNARFTLEALNHLLLYACGAAVFAHVLTPRRAGRLFGRPANCCLFLSIGVAVGVLFSVVSDVKSLRTSLSTSSGYDTAFVVVLGLLGGVVVAAFGFQIYLAHHHGGVLRYLCPRFVLVLVYFAYSWALVENGDSWEFHHYWLAWIGSLFCPFDHPVSIFCLAACTGVFCQGVAAYGTAEIFTKGAS